jgi:hypothetical protein
MNCAVAHLKSTEATIQSLESVLHYTDDVRENFFAECLSKMNMYESNKKLFEENDEKTHWITRLKLDPNQAHNDLLKQIHDLKNKDQSDRNEYFKGKKEFNKKITPQTKNGNTVH